MATYYVDSAAGIDTNAGTSPGAAWKSLTRVSTQVLLASDTVLFNRGGVWNTWDTTSGHAGGVLTIGESGANNSPITFGAYGTGVNPLITGFFTVPLTGWTQVGTSNVWTITDATHFPASMINVLLYNNAIAPLGRYPATGYITYTGSTGTTGISFASGSLPTTYVGGEVVIRKTNWGLTRGTITAETSTSITYTATGTNQLAPTNGYGFFVQNHQSTLTKAGDWSYNPTTKTLSMWFTSGPAGTIQVSVTDSLVSFSAARNYNVFTDISFQGANGYAINGNSASSNIQVNNCVFSDIGIHAIYFGAVNTCTINDNTITDCVNNAIYLSDAVGNNVFANLINNTGSIAGMGQSTDGTNGAGAYTGITINNVTTASDNMVTNNTILRTGYCGIFILGDTFLVDSNYIDTACYVVDDGGCIYTDVGGTGAHVYIGRTISNNILLNCLGAPDGAMGRNWANGIMCDDNTSNLTVANNKVYNSGQYGIYFHNSHEITCLNNLSYNNGVAQIGIQTDPIATNLPLPVNFIICNNIISNGSATQLFFRFRCLSSNSSQSDFTNFGICDSNVYSSPFAVMQAFSTQLTGQSAVLSDFPGWQSITKKDVNSTVAFPVSTTYGMILKEQNLPDFLS
ncbi:MAG: right-handed parallel beta-helix repeat-containing protein [Bacteroidetes bacterium]|nr:right-handed parallel beta-helix repeat-containing protein [Bacteroidota bacterium]